MAVLILRPSLELFALLLSIASVIAGFLAWWGANVTKTYAAKRDFEHLKRHYEQLSLNQGQILAEIDRLQDSTLLELRDLKNQLNILTIRILPDGTNRAN